MVVSHYNRNKFISTSNHVLNVLLFFCGSMILFFGENQFSFWDVRMGMFIEKLYETLFFYEKLDAAMSC